MSTPNRNKPIKNPFDDQKLGKLFFSPGVFKSRRKDSEGSTEEFRWSLEQQAIMAPAFIDYQQTVEEYSYENNEQIEMRVRNFFKHEHYIPSPEVFAMNKENMTPYRIERTRISLRDVGTQTDDPTSFDVSILPPDVDWEALMKEHKNHYKKNDESFVSATSSMGSRKRSFSLLAEPNDVSQMLEQKSGSNNSFNTTKDCSKFQRLSMGSFLLDTSDNSGPLGEISDEVTVDREFLDLSPIASPILSPISSSKPGPSGL